MVLQIKFMGHLKNIVGCEYVFMENVNGLTLREVLVRLHDSLGEASKEIFNGSSFKIRPGILILVNDAVYDVVGGLDYVVSEGDEIVFLPTVHGG